MEIRHCGNVATVDVLLLVNSNYFLSGFFCNEVDGIDAANLVAIVHFA
jgi:hypothetical protein